MQSLFGEDDTGKAWHKGKIAMMMNFIWATDFSKPEINPDYSGFQWNFYPFPVKESGDVSRPGLLIDSVGITKSCKNPDIAFEFLKYITYDNQGVYDRFDIMIITPRMSPKSHSRI